MLALRVILTVKTRKIKQVKFARRRGGGHFQNGFQCRINGNAPAFHSFSAKHSFLWLIWGYLYKQTDGNLKPAKIEKKHVNLDIGVGGVKENVE